MQVKVDLSKPLKKQTRDLSALQKKQIPFALQTAVNDLAAGAKVATQAEMKRVFDRPTAFTLNSLYVKKAHRGVSPEAIVGVRDYAGKGTPAWKYLEPEAQGGARRMKRFELALSQISGGRFVVPGPAAKLDDSGNISRGQIVQILSKLGAFGEQGYAANITPASSKRHQRKGMRISQRSQQQLSDIFVMRKWAGKGKGEPVGIFQLTNPAEGKKGGAVPILLFTSRAPSYQPRFDMQRTVERYVGRNADAALKRALSHALATAR